MIFMEVAFNFRNFYLTFVKNMIMMGVLLESRYQMKIYSVTEIFADL